MDLYGFKGGTFGAQFHGGERGGDFSIARLVESLMVGSERRVEEQVDRRGSDSFISQHLNDLSRSSQYGAYGLEHPVEALMLGSFEKRARCRRNSSQPKL